MCSDEGGINNCFTLSGWIKIVESFAVFTLLMLHRIGDNTQQVIQGPQRQNVQSNIPIIVHNNDFLAIKMVLVHS